MSAPVAVLDEADPRLATRRHLLKGGGLLLAVAAVGVLPGKARAAGEEPTLHAIQAKSGGVPKPGEGLAYTGRDPAALIRIAPDNSITFIIPNVEMGQGIYTGDSQLLAEELEVGLDQIAIEAAPPDEKLYAQPLLKSQATGGSTSMRGSWVPFRQAGAAARMMLIAAAAAQWGVPAEQCTAKRAVITHGPTGRTLTYGAVSQAAAQQPVPDKIPLKPISQFALIGTSAPRLDVPSKTNGSAKFGIDIVVPGMKYASVAACPTLGGKLAGVDDTEARKIKGVLDVVKLDNAVAVTGETFFAANRGLAALKITWNDGPNANLASADLVGALRHGSAHGTPVPARSVGDVETALKNAAKTIEATYELPFLAHATMEPINAVVHVHDGECEIWVGTQVPVAAQQNAAKATGLPQEKIILHNQLIGGGFGRRLVAESVGQAAAIAKQVPYPVKMIWTREEDIQHDLYRPAYYDHLQAGLDANGKPTVWTDRVTGGSVLGVYLPNGLPQGKLDSDAVEGAAKPPYNFPAMRVDWVRQDPPIPITWWRGVGPTHNVFVVESFIDELAHAAGKDPVEFRLGIANHKRAAHVLQRAAKLAGWGGKLPPGKGRGVSLHDAFGSFVAAIVDVTVSPAGEVRLDHIVGVIDCGVAVNPNEVEAQLSGGLIFGLTAALYDEITFEKGRVQQSNFNNYRMMRMDDTPPIVVEVVKSTELPGGVGETGTVSAAPALGNAIFAATGQRLRRYPFRLYDLATKNAMQQVVG